MLSLSQIPSKLGCELGKNIKTKLMYLKSQLFYYMYLVKFKAFMHMYKTKTDIGVENPDTQKIDIFLYKMH